MLIAAVGTGLIVRPSLVFANSVSVKTQSTTDCALFDPLIASLNGELQRLGQDPAKAGKRVKAELEAAIAKASSAEKKADDELGKAVDDIAVEAVFFAASEFLAGLVVGLAGVAATPGIAGATVVTLVGIGTYSIIRAALDVESPDQALLAVADAGSGRLATFFDEDTAKALGQTLTAEAKRIGKAAEKVGGYLTKFSFGTMTYDVWVKSGKVAELQMQTKALKAEFESLAKLDPTVIAEVRTQQVQLSIAAFERLRSTTGCVVIPQQ